MKYYYIYKNLKCNYFKYYLISTKKKMIFEIMAFQLHDLCRKYYKNQNNLYNLNIKVFQLGDKNILAIEFIFPEDMSMNLMQQVVSEILDLLNFLNISNIDLYMNIKKTCIYNLEKKRYNSFTYCQDIIMSTLYNRENDFILELSEYNNFIFNHLRNEETYLFYLGKNICNTNKIQSIKLEKKLLVHNFTPDNIFIERKLGFSIIEVVCNLPKFNVLNIIDYSLLSSYLSHVLHNRIREEQGMAYYAGTEFDKMINKLVIRIGTDSKNFVKVLDEINTSFSQTKKGDISNFYLKYAKSFKKNEFAVIADGPFSQISLLFEYVLLGAEFNRSSTMKSIENFDTNMLVSLMQNINLDFILKVKGQE